MSNQKPSVLENRGSDFIKTNKKVILVDMDGVLVDEPNADELASIPSDIHWSDHPGIFLKLKPIPGAIEAYNKLSENYDLFIVSTAPWANPSAWTDKRLWVEKYLPEATRRLFLTHRKDLVHGDYIIDDRLKNGVERFPGTVIQFGTGQFKTWADVLRFFEDELLSDLL
jgi:5'(3')-deoxyribonucleotidase